MSKLKPHEFDALTETEREVLDATAKQYGKLPAGRLIELTHKAWVASNQQRNAGSSVEIPWELFLEEDQPGLREHIDEHQETDTFLQAMGRAARR